MREGREGSWGMEVREEQANAGGRGSLEKRDILSLFLSFYVFQS